MLAAVLLLLAPVRTASAGDDAVTARGQQPAAAATVQLRGVVVGRDGAPVSGARVWVLERSESTAEQPHAVTGEHGELALTVPAALQWVVVCADGYLQATEIVPYPGEPVRIALEPAARLHGHVRGPDGEPAPGARVRVLPDDLLGSSVRWRFATICPTADAVVTDAAGRYAFSRLEPGRTRLVAELAEARPTGSGPLDLAAGNDLRCDFVLEAGETLVGTVRGDGGEPLAGARVEVWTEPGAVSARTAEDGSFRLAGVGAGYLQVHAWADGYVSATVSRDIDSVGRPLEIVLSPEGPPIEVTGTVRSAGGEALSGVRVAGLGREAMTAADGSYLLRSVETRFREPTTTYFVASKPGHATVRLEPTLSAARSTVDFYLEQGTRVRGQLHAMPGGEPVAGVVTLALLSRDGQTQQEESATVDAAGRYALPPARAGTWKLTARSGERLLSRMLSLGGRGDELVVDLDLPAVFPVSGTVVDADGRPVARAALSVSDGTATVGRAFTHADGTFSLTLPAGDLQLAASLGRASAVVPVRVTNGALAGLVIEVGEPARIPALTTEEVP